MALRKFEVPPPPTPFFGWGPLPCHGHLESILQPTKEEVAKNRPQVPTIRGGVAWVRLGGARGPKGPLPDRFSPVQEDQHRAPGAPGPSHPRLHQALPPLEAQELRLWQRPASEKCCRLPFGSCWFVSCFVCLLVCFVLFPVSLPSRDLPWRVSTKRECGRRVVWVGRNKSVVSCWFAQPRKVGSRHFVFGKLGAKGRIFCAKIRRIVFEGRPYLPTDTKGGIVSGDLLSKP